MVKDIFGRGALTRRSALVGATLAATAPAPFALAAAAANERPAPSEGSIPALREEPAGALGRWAYRPEWVNQVREAPVEPELAILDAQHHFHDGAAGDATESAHFTLEDLIVTIKASGHKVVG